MLNLCVNKILIQWILNYYNTSFRLHNSSSISQLDENALKSFEKEPSRLA